MKSFLILLVISVLFSCGSQAGYVLKGEFKGAGNGRAVLLMSSEDQRVISDTVEMKGGKFVFEGEVPDAGWATVVVEPEGKEGVRMMLALENSRIEMRGDWNNLGMDENEELAVLGMQIIGSKNQDVYEQVEGQYKAVKELPEFTKFAEILEKVLETPEILEDTTFYREYKKGYDVWIARVKKEQLKIMAANPSVEMVAYELGYMKDNMTLEQLEQVFGQFDVKVQQSKWGKAIRESIELRQRIEPGRLAPEFTLARRDSSLVSLADYRGKVVVLDFWASWCRPCRASFPWVREFYEEYCEKGVEIIGVSIDENKTSWEKALDEERLPWPQVIDEIEKGRSRVGGLYHVLAVPMFVVVDKEGKIVVRAHMEKKELSAVVEKVLGK
ncbi:TlpA disulfide reductase family protein [Butyricimonas paravirosa]|uniref:TlpA disulfide reductase family protein n=1 Tax=Butyricimonas paravirosa TaxID=1472417 RepID=UPI0022E8CC65|nr:TlpA disulfide reductase family protein [Butyricimonas paravirosa]